MGVYATETQAWPETPPEDADKLLRTASWLVDQLLVQYRYPVDSAGMPTDPEHVQALQDATVTIAHELEAQGSLTTGNAGEQSWGSVSIGNVSLSNPLTSSAESVTVAGLPVPVVALVYLSSVGDRSVTFR